MSLSRRELMTLARFDTDAASAIVAMLGEGDVAARVTEPQILAAAFNALDEIHSALLSDVPLGARLGQLFALRNEDWIVPFGYAAARATDGRVAPAVRDRLNSYGPDRVLGPDEPRFDMLAAVRIADEAGDLPAFVELLAKESGNAPAARDLHYLIDCRNGWSEAMGRLFEHTDVPPASTETTSDEPPPPGPVVHPDDLQKDRWGGRADVSGRRVSAVIDSVERNVFYFSATVESTDGTKLEGPVVFHLHDSYPRSVVRLKRVYDSRYVTLSEWSATGVFAIGVQVRDGFGRWMSLELDLANLPNLPPRFKSR
jgi:hypothetical protein